ncbi:Cardiolipin synthase [uncultured archaeon]|nr:Cardiolipin synthase [uncultured archaeon]
MVAKNFEVLSNPIKIYRRMLEDIRGAKKFIFLENYIYRNDEVGREFREALTKKAREGVKIKILLDSYGSWVDERFFRELTKVGGEVRFFREIQYTWRIVSKNHERDHRKLLLIDNKISYIGSINITKDFIDWRELVLRLEGDITFDFVRAFNSTWRNYGQITLKKVFRFIHEEFEIIQDIPSDLKRYTEEKYVHLIKKAKKEILIETPYFIPSFRIRRAFLNAVKRKVKIKIILPYRSNWRIVDVLRNRYLGFLNNVGAQIYYYKPGMLHSKLLIVDGSFFILGSSNLDYRSLIHNFEINLLGRNKDISLALKDHFEETLTHSQPFSFSDWRRRSSAIKVLELIFEKIKRFF